MKTNELMLGDWVIHGFGFNGKVTEIDLNVVTIYDQGLDDGDGHCEVTFAWNEVKPIPITAEILKKNFDVQCDSYTYYTDYTELEIREYTDGLWEVVIDEIEMSGLPTWKMYVSNVHELQHALRLCGIDKEIII